MPAATKLTDEVIQAICARKRAEPEITQDQLAAEFALHRNSINKALIMLDAPATSAAASADSGIAMITYDNIRTSPFNPRKTFAEAELLELAESIATNGLLQNLVVRPDVAKGSYHLVAGERRFRAIGILREAGRWDAPVPCRIIEADSGTHLAIALLENLQRQDVPPLEEADAFLQLQNIAPEFWTAQAIALRISRTPRYVYQRLALANKLAPAARDALAKGRINIEAARLLTTATPEVQTDILDRATDCDDADGTGKISAEAISDELWGTLIYVRDAIFDVAASDLEIVEVEGEQYFTDRKAAIEAQMQAVALKAKELKKAWAFVTVMEVGERFYPAEWLHGKTKAQGGGAVIAISKPDYEVLFHTGVLKKPEEQPKKIDTSAIEAQRKEAQEKREAAQKALFDRFNAVAKKLPSDWQAPAEDGDGKNYCLDGCKWRELLSYKAPGDFHVCTNPASPRAGMLTHDEQGGNGCFEVA